MYRFRVASAGAVERLLAELSLAPLYPESEDVFRIREAKACMAIGDFLQLPYLV